jgi:hypothetical protein
LAEASPVVAAMERARAQLLRRDAARATDLVRAYGLIWRDLQGQVEDLGRLIEAGEDKARLRSRVRQMQAQIEAEIRRYAAYADQQVTRAIQEAIAQANKDSGALVRAGYGEAGDMVIKGAFNQLATEAVENALGMLGADSPLRHRMEERLGEPVAKGVADKLLEGIALGWNPNKIQAALRKAFGAGLEWSIRATRTAEIWAYREATRASYVANSHLVQGWVWSAAHDLRTCISCIALDGTVHPVTEVLNDHHQGRCTARPKLVDPRELGLPGPVHVEPEPARDWFGKLSPAAQREMMGGEMWELWHSGKVGWNDLSAEYRDEVYGPMRRAPSVRDLRAALDLEKEA